MEKFENLMFFWLRYIKNYVFYVKCNKILEILNFRITGSFKFFEISENFDISGMSPEFQKTYNFIIF